MLLPAPMSAGAGSLLLATGLHTDLEPRMTRIATDLPLRPIIPSMKFSTIRNESNSRFRGRSEDLRLGTNAKSRPIPHSLPTIRLRPHHLHGYPRHQANQQPNCLLGNCFWNEEKGLMMLDKQISRRRPAFQPQTCWRQGSACPPNR